MSRKIIISAGGTGGHLYPALGTAFKLLEQEPGMQIVFVAGGLATNPFFDRSAFSWYSVSAAPLSIQTPWNVVKNCGVIVKGIWQSSQLLYSFKPDLVIGFGSYHSFPVLSAARLQRYPIVLHEQNSKPGKVIRLFSRHALLTGVYFPSASQFLKGNTSLLTMPLRDGFSRNACSREAACCYFGIDPNRFTILVFGGSQGAQFINKAVTDLLCGLNVPHSQVLHFTGQEIETARVNEAYSKAGIRAVVKTLENRMDYAWRAADLAIVRAGAGTIAEQIEFEVPAIFIPYPHAADKHQDSNADFVVDCVKGGWKWNENSWSSIDHSATLQQLLQCNSRQLSEKLQNLALYKKNSSSAQFTTEICRILAQGL